MNQTTSQWCLAAAVVSLTSLSALAAPEPIAPGPAEVALAKKFAPLIVLSKDEPYLPSSIEWFAPHVTVQCKGGSAPSVTAAALPAVATSGNGDCFLTTKEKLNGPDHILGFFHGVDPTREKVPVYATFYKSVKHPGALNIQFFTFWPYNWGKNVCLSLAPKDHCVAKRHQMDNHVGDWEGVTVQVKDGQLVGVRVGAHAASRIGYTFLASAKGKCEDESGFGDLNKEVPLSCLEIRNGHPVVYSAWGSHGMWGKKGDHNYQTLPTGERLVDHTPPGKNWNTWEAIVATDGKTVLPFRYQGRWGNSHETAPHNRNACKLSPVPHKLCAPAGIPADEFELNDGPHTPEHARDWEKL